MSRSLLIALLVMNSGPAFAEWMWIDKGKPGMTIYVNPDTIHHKEHLVTMWELFDFETAEYVADTSHLSFKMHSEYDCSGGLKRELGTTFFSGNMGHGKVVRRYSTKYKWEPIVQGSVNEDLWKFACGEQRLTSQLLTVAIERR